MEIFDSHCHLNFEHFDKDREHIIQQCLKKNISSILIPSAEKTDWEKIAFLCNKHRSTLFPAYGLHPVFIEKHAAADLISLDDFVQNHTVYAIGEIGLDFYIKSLDKEKQLQFFVTQLQIAEKHSLPVILHVRKAHDTVLHELKASGVSQGIVHAFNGSLQQAEKYIEMGFFLGFGGTMTYKNAHRIHRLAARLPIESIVLETDAPDMVVAEHKGKRNSPEYITYSLEALSRIRKQPVETVAKITTNNARRILNLD
ncbi:MAG: TatD family hydrolase [Gammaproteobacteria bacterium]